MEDGHITELFTNKEKTTFVTQKQLLFILNPLKEQEFYAKIKLKEEEIKDIHPGQLVHMKLTAFNHYKYGVLKGNVVHINKMMENEKVEPELQGGFYAIVDIPESEAQKMNLKSGFKVKADIILEKVRLYQFIFESMFT